MLAFLLRFYFCKLFYKIIVKKWNPALYFQKLSGKLDEKKSIEGGEQDGE